MSDHEVEVGRVGGTRRGSSLRSVATVLAVPIAVVAIAAFAVLGSRLEPASASRTSPSPSRPASAPAAAERQAPADLAIEVPLGEVPLDFTHRPLADIEPGLTGTARAELAQGHAYTLLVRCGGAGDVRWSVGPNGGPSALGDLPCDGEVHSSDLPAVPAGARSAGVDLSFDLAADTHIVVVETGRLTRTGDVVAVPPGPDGSRPADLGVPTDAITVEAVLEDDVYTGLVVRRLSLDGSAAAIAIIPSSAFPPNATPTLYDGWAAISRAGFLAVPFEAADESDEVAVFDLTDPASPAAVVGDRATDFGWGPDGQLAVFRGEGIGIFDPITRRVDAVPVAPDVKLGNGLSWTTDGRIAATRAAGDSVELGEIRSDGVFLPGEWPMFDPRGIERPRSADGRTLGEACETDTTGGGCFLTVSDPAGRHVQPWTAGIAAGAADDGLWAADGRSVWLLASSGEGRARLVHSRSPTSGDVVARFSLGNMAYESPVVVGASADDAAIAIGIETREVIVVDTRSGATHRVKGAFAGWADTRGSVYPLPASS